jgi:endo-1,4-beta-xylanase
MKNKAKFAGIIAIAAFIGFTLISCKGPSDVQTVATDKTLVSIAVTPPTKTQYNLNESSLDTAGMVVTATYSDNSTEEIPTEDTAITGFDSTTAGPIDITVSYGGQTATFTITVQGSVPSKTLVSIAVTTPPTKTQYKMDENLNTAGMVVTATYSDTTTAAVSGYTLSGFDSSAAGSKTVTVTYEGKTTTFNVTVTDLVDSWKGLTVPSATTAQYLNSYQGKSEVLRVAPANTSSGYGWSVLSYSLADYVGQEISITVSMQVWLGVSTKVAWQINRSPYPVIAGNTSTNLTAGQWNTVSGTATVTPQSGDVLYLSKDQLVGGNPATIGTPTGNVEIYITDFTITINGTVVNPNPDPDAILYTKWPFMVGAAAPGAAFTTSNGQYPLLRQFEVLVAENDMKPDAVMPTSKPANFNTSNNNLGTQYRWTNADRLVNYAEANNTAIRGHVLIWHDQTPAWFFTGSGTDGRATKAELYTNMETHIKTVFEKYRGRVGWWDVCNEVVGDGGGPRPATSSKYTAIMEDSGLTGINQYEYVLKAFQWARQYADANGGTNVKLYLTDYNNEYSGTKQNSFSDLVDYLITNDAPIDGVGFQTHIRFDWPSTATISDAIDRFAGKTKQNGTKLMTQVCELDMSVFPGGSDTTLSDSVLAERLALQATKYRALFDIYKTKYNEGKLDAVLIWGLADGSSWLNNRPSGRVDHPLLFDRDFQPKAAYNRLVE